MNEKIGQIECHVAQKLETLLKNILHEAGYSVSDRDQLRVELHNPKRKTRSDASADHWSPRSGWMQIYVEPKLSQQEPETLATTPLKTQSVYAASSPPQGPRLENSGPGVYIHPAEADLLKALDRAEATPGWSFVPLKKFRDEILPSEHPVSMRTDVEQQHTLRSAIEKRLILVGKVPNPKSPQFPVTTIRLNRLMPEVRAVLGVGESPDLDFHPVEIRGEPLSTTVLRERR